MARRILMIDDDRLQFRLVLAHFKHFRFEAYDLEWAMTYEAGLEQLLSGTYAACLLDFQLGERDGLQLIREAMTRGCVTPIVFLTAESSEQIDIEAMHAGALDYLVKGEITQAALERSIRYAVKQGETLEALRKLARDDELTGLFNRREFDRIFEIEWTRARSFGQPLALVMVDVDHFKTVNDGHGHPTGDAVLREVARRLRGIVRMVDLVARFGGDEFALLLIQADRDTAWVTAQCACAALEREAVSVRADLSVPVTVSAGVAVLQTGAVTSAELIAAADRALYAAKVRGRNRAVSSDEIQP